MAGMFVFMLTMVVLILNAYLLKNIQALEKDFVSERMRRVSVAINFELDDLKKTVIDWAEWDDAYQFVQDGNQEFIEDNLGANFFLNLRLDSVVYMNKSGEFVYAQQVNDDATALEPVPDAVKEQLQLLVSSHKDSGTRGILKVPGGAMLVAATPVLTSNGEGPITGYLAVFRYLNSREITYLSTNIDQEIDVESAVPQEIRFEERLDRSKVDVRAISEKTIRGSTTLYDVFGRPAVSISLEMNRDMNMVVNTSVRSVLIALGVSSFIFTVLILIYTNRVILKRVLSMSSAIKSIGEHDDPAERLEPDGYCDELSGMISEINSMLDNIQESHMRISDSETALRSVAEELQQEVLERRKAQGKISFLAYHDHLTGLPNRLSFSEQLNRGIQSAKRADKMMAVLFLDLDGFKMINDSMGHLAGDLLLVGVSNRLKSILCDSGSIARLGGDEFAVMVEEITEEKAIEEIAEKVLASFREPFVLNKQECFITTSIGVAVFPQDGEDSETLIKNADVAMYRAKEKGKNQFVMCSEGIKSKVLETMRISNHLFRVLERGELEVLYQPQINCSTKRIAGAEALIRWNHPEMGVVLPGKFISIAEQTGLILPIGEWVLRTACMQNKAWQNAGYPAIRVGVNLSVRQFQNHNIVSEVQSILSDTGLDPACLELEITESIAMQEQGYIIEALHMLRRMGVHIAIDDFGTEYSSMNHLKQLPVDRIKIPMPFVHGIDMGPKDQAITKSIIVLAKSLGLSVIAEGVETKTQNDFLLQKMCDEIQGFYYYKPMCSSDFEKLLELQMPMEQNSLGWKHRVANMGVMQGCF